MWYYVANLARYVLVQADSPERARELGQAQLPTPVRTVRPATPDEVALLQWHESQERREGR